ncbi:MAG: DUF1722 domain-containing protein [Candidatus Krumholzibacteriota bacterium]|nr:DUF1722 domain-containing protein [Candidatus Krumholzibacteriota bacterium]
MKNVRPKIVISKCLGFDRCRYDGTDVPVPFLGRMKKYIDFIPVCPEVEIGLGIPRDPILAVGTRGSKRLIQPSTGRDLTKDITEFSDRFLSSLDQADGFILKDRSPSCGLRGVKVFRSPEAISHSGKGPGFFGSAVLSRFKHLAIEDENRLDDLRFREHFLTKLFTLARFREAASERGISGIAGFHSENVLLLSAYSQKGLRALGRILANPGEKPEAEVASLYAEQLYSALKRPPRFASNIDLLLQAIGNFSYLLSHGEKGYFLETIERYRDRKIPLSSLLLLVRVWIDRFRTKELMEQSYFSPYPDGLLNITDSASGRECMESNTRGPSIQKAAIPDPETSES